MAPMKTLVLSIALTSICGVALAATPPEAPPPAAASAPAAARRPAFVVLLPPVAQFPEFVDGQDPVEEELTALLVGAGYKVRRVVRAEFVQALTEEAAAVGGIYDPLTGQRSAARSDAALARLTRRIVDEKDDAVVLSPRLVLRTATVRGDAAEWDGQVRMGRTNQAIDRTVVWTGTTRGLSLELTAFGPDGARLFTTYGGLLLPYRMDMRTSTMELRRNMFSQRDELVQGSTVALEPLLGAARR